MSNPISIMTVNAMTHPNMKYALILVNERFGFRTNKTQVGQSGSLPIASNS
jgi:hypothetical protein